MPLVNITTNNDMRILCARLKSNDAELVNLQIIFAERYKQDISPGMNALLSEALCITTVVQSLTFNIFLPGNYEEQYHLAFDRIPSVLIGDVSYH